MAPDDSLPDGAKARARLPALTLVIVTGFTRPAFLVEATAAKA